jgi:hypothetical protein
MGIRTSVGLLLAYSVEKLLFVEFQALLWKHEPIKTMS